MVDKVGEFLLTEATFLVTVDRWPLEAELEGVARVARVVNTLRRGWNTRGVPFHFAYRAFI